MRKTKIFKNLVVDTAVVALFLFVPFSQNLHHGTFATAQADELVGENSFQSSYPYNSTFIISAYYSPLPCQNRYATGSYEGDIRLNGRGTNGADGTPVYPGMIAAPKTYAFGTKMYVPGVGIVAVHDRGGAIVNAGERGHSFDRLDIWMGYGDQGLQRALNWGKRNVDVTVYGITDSVIEDVQITGYAESEKVSNQCTYNEADSVPQIIEPKESFALVSLSLGDSGEKVKELQKELISLNFLGTEATGTFDEVTEHAVFKFQQSQGIVTSKNENGAGVFGPQTRGRLSAIVGERQNILALIEQASDEAPNSNIAWKKEEDENLVGLK